MKKDTCNSKHNTDDRYGVNMGKVFVMRRGKIVRNSQNQPVMFDPSGIQRGDVICGFDLQPLRTPHKKKGVTQ